MTRYESLVNWAVVDRIRNVCAVWGVGVDALNVL